MHLALIGPAPDGRATNVYATRLAAALRARGHQVDELRHPDQLPGAATPVIDALVLPRFADRIEELARRGATGLVHHPGAHVAYDGGTPGAEAPLLRALPRLVASSTPVAARLRNEYGVVGDRIRVVEPGIDRLPRSPGSGDGCAILSVGVLAPRKGFEVLVTALRRLPDLDWTLTIAGDARRDPAHVESLHALIGSGLSDDRIRVVPDPGVDVLEALWRRADLFALATRWEGYATTTAEALCRGLPVATTNGGGAGALVTPEAGAVCPVDDVDTLSKSLRRMIYDRPLRAQMADAAFQAGEALPGWDSVAERFVAALEA